MMRDVIIIQFIINYIYLKCILENKNILEVNIILIFYNIY